MRGRRIMKFILIDLEWNGAPLYKTGGYFNEIIEIGAVKLDQSLETVSTFQMLVKPVVHKKLTGRVKRLTHISNDEVRAAQPFAETLQAFIEWVGEEENCFMSWGTGDLSVMIENLKHFGMEECPGFIDRYMDAQELCRRKLGMEKAKQPGLSNVAELAGIHFEDMEMHRALDDSIVMAKCVKALWDEAVAAELTYVFDKEFLRRLFFKAYYVSDPRNELVDITLFEQDCPKCGAKLVQLTKPRQRSRQIWIDYLCEGCDAQMTGRHRFRVLYEGVQHKVIWKDKVPEEQESEQSETAEEIPNNDD